MPSGKGISKAGLNIDDMDVIEINEAFAAQAWLAFAHLALPMTRRVSKWRGDCAWSSAGYVWRAIGADGSL